MFDDQLSLSILVSRATGLSTPFMEQNEIEEAFGELLANANMSLIPKILLWIERPPQYLCEDPIYQELWDKTIGEYLAACGKEDSVRFFESITGVFGSTNRRSRNALIWSASFFDEDYQIKFFRWLTENANLDESNLQLIADLVCERPTVNSVSFLNTFSSLPTLPEETRELIEKTKNSFLDR